MTAFCLPVLLTAALCRGEEAAHGIARLHRLDQLPRLKNTVKVGSISSYDRTGGNNDGFSGQYSFVRKEKDGLVLADLKGPGVITRIWTPTPTDDKVAFYFDGEAEPRIEVSFLGLFTGKEPPFEAPLSGFGAGGFYAYLPLPFEKSCKVLIKAEHTRFYQINYAIYPKGTAIASYPKKPSAAYLKDLARAKQLFSMSGSGKDLSAYTLGRETIAKTVKTQKTLKPGGSAVIFQSQQGGRIGALRISPASALADKSRRIILKAFWDDSSKPAICCPAGDFFGYAWGQPAMASLMVGTKGETNYCYFPMPFDASARIELHAEGKTGQSIAIETETVFSPVPKTAGEGKFYCLWRRENPTVKGKPFTFINTQGRGHIVGCIQQSQGMETGNTLYFEGDDQTTIDGRLAIHGTGSEDFYNGGWYDVPGRWETRKSFPLSGCLAYKKHLGRTGGYRLMICDAYDYKKSILQTIEHAPTGNEMINDYCGVTYLYSDKRPTCDITLPALKDRRVVDPERIVFATWWNIPIYAFTFNDVKLTKNNITIGKENVRSLGMTARKEDWFGHPFISFICELPAAGNYQVSLDAVKGPDQGMVQIFVDEAPVGRTVDLYAPKQEKALGLNLAVLPLKEGNNNILIKIIGKNEKATGYGLDLINIICEKVKSKPAKDARQAVKTSQAESAILVSKKTLADSAWKPVAETLVKQYGASIITFEEHPEEALPRLKAQFPRYLCVVAPPLTVTRQFVADIHGLTRRLDADPYTDVIWGILTGYDASDALRLAKHAAPLTVRKVASGTDVELPLCEEGTWYCELKKNRMVSKAKGGAPVEGKGPDDTTQALAGLLNDYKADLFVTSGHATERDWQIGYSYRNGKFISKAGRLTGVATDGSRHPILSPNPKVYLPIGNCLMGHIDGLDAMALAFIHSAGIHQMIGYTVPTWYGYAGWGCLDYFLEQPGRYTFAEAFFANQHALIHRLQTYFPELTGLTAQPGKMPRTPITLRNRAKQAGLSAHDARGLLFDRDVVAFYGIPMWQARMADNALRWAQTLTEKNGEYTFTIKPLAGKNTFAPVNINGSQRGGRPIVQYLPHRIGKPVILQDDGLKPVITDDFILVPHPGTGRVPKTCSVRFKAEKL